MFTRTCKWFCALSALLLAGCDGAFDGFNVTRTAPERIELPDGLVVSGSHGWCVDTETTQTAAETSVVVLGSCAAIANNARAPRPDVPGVVTVSVDSSGGAVPSVRQLDDFLSSEGGRAALARDGSAESVRILERRREDNMLVVRVVDRSLPAAAGAAADYWRALFGIGGRFVTVSLTGSRERPIDSADGYETLVAQVGEIRASNIR